ncbi:MAG: NmrA family NAD(P)-binding protein [Acidimicrobiales bacterium]
MHDPIAVLGATGRTGGATARHLLGQGAPVRVLTRDPDNPAARALQDLGAQVVPADMGDDRSLKDALDGVTRLFNVQPAFDSRGRYQGEAELAQGAAVARAAGAVGVQHVVQLAAGRGVPSGLPHFDAKLTIRRGFEAEGITVTAIHPGPFMELMVDPGFAPALAVWGKEPRIVGWDRPVPWVAVSDIGRVAGAALTGPVPDTGSTVELIGDLRSLGECRRLLTEAGRRPRRVPIPTFLFRAMVGDEFLEMWRWLTTVDDFTVTEGLLDVPAWVDRLAD